MAEQMCPACYRVMPSGRTICPHCGIDLAALSTRDYRDKLMAALGHPLDDVRLRAIFILGLRGEAEAAEALAECALRHPVNVVEGLAVVSALPRLGLTGRMALRKLAERDPAHAVRQAARVAAVTPPGGGHA